MKWSRMSWHFCSIDGGGGDVPGGQVAPGVAEDPRALDSALARSSRRRSRVYSIIRRASCGVRMSPLPIDGDRLDRRDDLGDAVEPGLAGEPHLGGAAVDGDQRHAGVFQPAGQRGRDDAGVVPPEPQLGGERDVAQRRATIFSTMRSVRSGSQSSLLPPSRLVTLSTGQPMLMSTTIRPVVLGPAGGVAEQSGRRRRTVASPAASLPGRWRPVPSTACSRAARPRGRAGRCRPAPRRRRTAPRAGTRRRSSRRSAQAAGWSPATPDQFEGVKPCGGLCYIAKGVDAMEALTTVNAKIVRSRMPDRGRLSDAYVVVAAVCWRLAHAWRGGALCFAGRCLRAI